MSLLQILAFSLLALAAGWLVPRRWRVWYLLGGSVLAIYWLQPSTPIRNLDFWLPTTSIGLTIFVWVVTRQKNGSSGLPAAIASIIILGIVLLIGLTRYVDALCCITPTRPPPLLSVFTAIGVAFILFAIPLLLPKTRNLTSIAILLILSLFIILKSEPIAQKTSFWLRSSTGQSVTLASAVDIPWLGYSYLAFRLLHVLRDDQADRLPTYSLGEFVTYAIFFPTYTAGPIDRVQRFMPELDQQPNPDDHTDIDQAKRTNLVQGGWRILWGIFKKFVLADSLALIAMSPQNVSQTTSSIYMWALVYAYSLRIYFDFSGYTDIAIGLGRLMDFHLPENFDKPYLKLNITAFWNSWHITLAQWFRAYFFNPLTRWLRAYPDKFPMWTIMLIGQFSTMALIGLWHGITWNFFLWGAWHGLGLFVQNRWSTWISPQIAGLENRPLLYNGFRIGGWFLTFQFVCLGWVWFAIPEVNMALEVFQKLVGF